MKKFFAFFVLVLYFMSSNCCFALSELYYLKNANKNTIAFQVETVLLENNYNIKKKNSFYAISNKDNEDFAVIVLQQSGQNLFYYYEANDGNKKINKKVLKSFRKDDIEYEESENEMHLKNFAQIAARTKTGEKKTYSFEEPKKTTVQQPKAPQAKKPSTALQGFVGKISSGTKVNVYLQHALNTATAQKGDAVAAVLNQDWVYKNCIVAPKGSLMYGTVTKANKATLGSRNGSVQIYFNKLVSPAGKTYDISTEKIDFNVTNDGKIEKTVTSTLTMAVIGALVGLGIAALTGDPSNLAQGAIIGASVGGGSALVSSVAEKGIDAEIPSFTEVEAILDKPLNVVLSY